MRSSDGRRRVAKLRIADVEAVLRRWDPIGIEPGSFGPSDEYDSYAPHIVTMLVGGCTLNEISRHLEQLRTETIGLEPEPVVDARFAEELLNLWK